MRVTFCINFRRHVQQELQPLHLVKQDQELLDILWGTEGVMEQLHGQTREITDFFWVQEKHAIAEM